jgi:hypothetical protein
MSIISSNWIELGCSMGSVLLLIVAAMSLSKIDFKAIRAPAAVAKNVKSAQQLSKITGLVALVLVVAIAYLYYVNSKESATESQVANMLTSLNVIRMCNIASFLLICMVSYHLSKIPAAMFMGKSKMHYTNASRSAMGYIVVMVLCYMFKLGKLATFDPNNRTYVGGTYY